MSARFTSIGVALLMGLMGCVHGPSANVKLGSAGESGSGSAGNVVPVVNETRGFRFGVGDLLTVRVYREKELSGDYMVDKEGTILFPLAGRIPVEKMSPNEVADKLTKVLGSDYLKNPQVSVIVKSINSRRVSVLGEVQKPGTFKYQDQISLVESITRAGGLGKLAAANRVKITRKKGSDEVTFVVALDRILEGRAPNMMLQPGDVVFIPESLF